MKSSKKNRWTVLALLACLLIPMALAQYFYTHADKYALTKSNHGDLITPLLPLKDVKFVNAQGALQLWQQPRQQWVMMNYNVSCVDQPTYRRIYYMRQVRTALGKDRGRLQNLLVLPKKCKLATAKERLKKAYPNFQLILSDRKGRQAFEKALQARHLTLPGNSSGAIYLVDPAGNIMMRFTDKIPPKDWYKDVKHLLRVSQIG